MIIEHSYLYTPLVPLILQQGYWAQKLEIGGVIQIVWIVFKEKGCGDVLKKVMGTIS